MRILADTHTHMSDKPTGKTTLMKSMIQADMEAGYGLTVIDPHGELYQDLELNPENRTKDVILFNPADYLFPIGF